MTLDQAIKNAAIAMLDEVFSPTDELSLRARSFAALMCAIRLADGLVEDDGETLVKIPVSASVLERVIDSAASMLATAMQDEGAETARQFAEAFASAANNLTDQLAARSPLAAADFPPATPSRKLH